MSKHHHWHFGDGFLKAVRFAHRITHQGPIGKLHDAIARKIPKPWSIFVKIGTGSSELIHHAMLKGHLLRLKDLSPEERAKWAHKKGKLLSATSLNTMVPYGELSARAQAGERTRVQGLVLSELTRAKAAGNLHAHNALQAIEDVHSVQHGRLPLAVAHARLEAIAGAHQHRSVPLWGQQLVYHVRVRGRRFDVTPVGG